MIYRLFFRLVLCRVDPERVHALAFGALRVAYAIPPKRWLITRFTTPSRRLSVTAFGVEFPSPLGVAAGVDKDARFFRELGMLGFGHVEIGSVTPRPQAGNPRPRVFRVIAARALINRMGFPNAGAAAVGAAIAARAGRPVLGVNLGKNKDTAADAAADDYGAVASQLGSKADFVVVNVSSPNTPGLRDLQAVAPLRAILVSVQAATERPVLLKISPDLADSDIDEIADLALELELDGIVCTNTTISRAELPEGQYEIGGLSGAPLNARALAVLRRLRIRVGERLVLVSVGGVSHADDAWERVQAGATLVQAYTGFVYGGPLWARRINRGLDARLKASGFTSLADAVGSGVDPQRV
ncbi:MAG TPA: quinone-dependent dihydroorotate dehydrogenase [Baekduia sp.]|nr:quinone-dependent dihydroorotate dehydrogenase [Baekduia sp.]